MFECEIFYPVNISFHFYSILNRSIIRVPDIKAYKNATDLDEIHEMNVKM